MFFLFVFVCVCVFLFVCCCFVCVCMFFFFWWGGVAKHITVGLFVVVFCFVNEPQKLAELPSAG